MPRVRSARVSEESGHPSSRSQQKNPFDRPAVRIGAIVVAALLFLGALGWWLHARRFESTDDAFIDAHIVHLAPQINGQVVTVLAQDNELVHAGELLVEIDAASPRARFEQSEAQRAQAETELGQSRAQLIASAASRRQAIANLAAAAAQDEKAQKDLERYRSLSLSTPQAVAQEQLDQAIAAAQAARAQRHAVAQQVQSADAQIEAANAQIEGAQARVRTAQAQKREAELNVGYTRVSAPITGHIAQKTVAVGSYVTPGQQLMAIVPVAVWVTANFKETQLALMRVQQPVRIRIDACPGVDVRGHVDSIQRGAGQAFALLPPENATGNYVKVVQRVPVKILLDAVPQGCVLGPGMSVEPRVSVR